VRLCVYGAGAIGGYLAVQLALAGHEVCVVARGPHLRAIRERGLKLVINGSEKVAHVAASDDPRDLGPQDMVICALKAHQAYECAKDFVSLLGPDSAVVTAMNGIPWWYFYKDRGRFEDRHLDSVDPGGRQWHYIGPERAIGCVVDPACEVVAPGVIVHHEFKRFTLGEPDGSRSSRVMGLSKALTEAGFEAPVRENIRWNVWLKLWGNVCFNPISALTGATLDRITSSPPPGQSSGTKCPCCRTWNAAARWKLTRWLPLSRNWDYSPVSQRQPSMLCWRWSRSARMHRGSISPFDHNPHPTEPTDASWIHGTFAVPLGHGHGGAEAGGGVAIENATRT
jgi:2-dehydropantoate 2-reductase